MTEAEVKPFVGKPIRMTLADGRVLAGTLHSEDTHGHGHAHYAVVSDPVKQGDRPVRELVHGADQITQIENAANDPAAIE
jgi:hypothetical protein